MIPELAELLKTSIEQSLEDKVAVAFSGGVDSSLIAYVAKQNCEVGLFTCGTPISEDLVYAERVASAMKLPLNKHIFEDSQILGIYEKCQKICPGDLLKVELLVPVYKVCEMAKKKDLRLCFLVRQVKNYLLDMNDIILILQKEKI